MTLDDVSDVEKIAASLAALPVKPVARVVFDRGQQPADYVDAVGTLKPVASIMGTPVDSSDAKKYSLAEYADRFRAYVGAFGPDVAVWEVGNEVNGEWTGSSQDSAAKTAAAFDIVHAAGGKTAVTLYYNPDCYSDKNNAMLTWARAQLADRLKTGVDYVLVSYYEADCNGHQPAQAEWRTVFAGLRAIFPSAQLGFGEIGAPESASPDAKADYLRRYYTMPAPVVGFVGGYFWWYYAEDALPYAGNPVWDALRGVMSAA